ncbi:MAG: hypothetical protein Q8R15_03690 [Candidatus Micrarchaeota archaeon]|nr:hypothetical protein [Candidatus Micrarchaeota archaeon]
MGVNYYVVVPKLQIKIYIGKHVSEEDAKEYVEKLNKIIENNAEGKYEVEAESINYKEITVKDIARLVTFYEDASYLLDDRLTTNILICEFLRIFPDAKLVADCSEEYNNYADYIEYPIDEPT